MTDTFSNYMRLCVTNYGTIDSLTHSLTHSLPYLGIIGWQDAYTPEGLTDVTYQWMSMYCKARLLVNIINQKKLSNNE